MLPTAVPFTGVDIRKALLAAHLRPNKFDEGALFTHLNDPKNWCFDYTEEQIAELAQHKFAL